MKESCESDTVDVVTSFVINTIGWFLHWQPFIIWSKLSTMFLKITFSPKKLQPLC